MNHTVKEVQKNFAEYLLNIKPTPCYCPKRMPLYKDSITIKLNTYLSNTYPTTLKILKKKAFEKIVQEFIHFCPPRTGILSQYGKEFSSFLKQQSLKKPWEDIAEVALLDWEIYKIKNCMPTKPLDLSQSQFSKLTPELLEQANLRLNTPYRLLAFEAPIGIYFTEERKKRRHVILRLQNLSFETFWLEEAYFLFLEGISENKPLEEAFHSALSKDRSFNLSEALAYFLKNNVLYIDLNKQSPLP